MHNFVDNRKVIFPVDYFEERPKRKTEGLLFSSYSMYGSEKGASLS